MLFNSIDFLIFFPIVVVIFFIVPLKLRYIWLFVVNYYFYMSWNPKYAFLIAISTITTYISSIFIEKCNKNGKVAARKWWVAASLISNLGILCFFKYSNFILENINKVIVHFGVDVIERRMDLLLPVGISFYTFQVIGYTIDVYRGEIKAEKNIIKYALFVSFFPQLMSGPIERSKNLLRQIQNIEKINVWNFERVRDGFLLMMWGLFQKLVIADRASLLVDNVIINYEIYGFFEISIAAILFAFQIYCDFGGYTSIARGAAQVMGFYLINNFRQPYLARDIKDFWRRWHISLTSWFTEYLYIPLGGSRKGIVKKYMNIFIVFGVSGLWHGASWNYIVWGLLHAIFQIVGDMRKILSRKFMWLAKKKQSWSTRLRETIVTFILVDFAWIFFVSNDFHHALNVIKQMFTIFQTTDIYGLGLNRGNWFFMIFGVLILLIVDVIHERGMSVFAIINKQEFWFRWILYIGLIWTIIMFGIYGHAYDTGTFIYFQF